MDEDVEVNFEEVERTVTALHNSERALYGLVEMLLPKLDANKVDPARAAAFKKQADFAHLGAAKAYTAFQETIYDFDEVDDDEIEIQKDMEASEIAAAGVE